jgi:hypothetical protein
MCTTRSGKAASATELPHKSLGVGPPGRKQISRNLMKGVPLGSCSRKRAKPFATADGKIRYSHLVGPTSSQWMVCVTPTLECGGLYARIPEWVGKYRNEDR